MKVIIAGGRDFKGQQWDWETIEILHRSCGFTEIVSGRCGRKKGDKRKAKGADGFGETFAKYHNIHIEPFYADWDKYDKAAGPIRNEEMASYANAVILFPGGRGTKNMRKWAQQYGLKILYDAQEGEHESNH